MSQPRQTGIYKKNKTMTQSPNPNLWDSYSKQRKQYSTFNKKKQKQQDMQWIGGIESTPPRPQTISHVGQSFQARPAATTNIFNNNNSTTLTNYQSPSKAPAQLIQDILRGLITNTKQTTVNPYYSEQSQQQLTQILTNQNKLQTFISQLQISMSQADVSVVRNYQMLIILLKHINKSDVQVKHSNKGLQLNFNRNLMIKQQNQIERLEKKIKQKDQHIKEIIEEYEGVIRNFNDVIEKLLEERTEGHHHHGNHMHGYNSRNHR